MTPITQRSPAPLAGSPITGTAVSGTAVGGTAVAGIPISGTAAAPVPGVAGSRLSGTRPLVVDSLSLSTRNYQFLQSHIYEHSGIVVEADKRYLVEARLLPLLRDHRLESLDQLSEVLAARPTTPLSKLVIEAMTTNETLFFRDPVMFDALRDTVLPALFAGLEGRRRLRIWSAAASSGQEAYSVAMLLLEMGKDRSHVEILGTDLDSQVLERARQGRYVQFEVNRGLPAQRLMKYFTRSGLDWVLRDEVRDMVTFEQRDLRRSLRALGVFDLILCRNVLIYFDQATKKHILGMVRELLAPGGLLVLGCAETVMGGHGPASTEDLQRKAVGQSSFYSR